LVGRGYERRERNADIRLNEEERNIADLDGENMMTMKSLNLSFIERYRDRESRNLTTSDFYFIMTRKGIMMYMKTRGSVRMQ